jgi:hypothetical protein
MDGFKQNPKIACFKEGGQVGYKTRNNHSESKEMTKDVKKDKAIVKKAVGQHESAKHKGEGKTELKLKSGGRCKKEGGNVRKYQKGGEVELKGNQNKIDKNNNGKIDADDFKLLHKKDGGEVIGMKKTAKDKKDIAGIKKKGSAPKKQAPKTKQAPAKPMGMAPAEFPMEGELPMFQMGGNVPVGQGQMSDMDRKMMEMERQRKMARTKNARGAGLNPGQMAQFAGQEMAAQGGITDAERAAAMRAMGAMGGMGGMGQLAPAPGGMGQAAPSNGMGQATPMGPGETESIMEGLRQLGKYAQGGCV